ncbi:MAG: alpha/beta fold hydrolase [Verrucomicrobia bacterium]|nr:alpha/beta fold hydrolase [Verrucomicrobiota bacterium]
MLLFLHGFLGQKEDWDPVLSHLPDVEKACINLPYNATDIALAIKDLCQNAKIIIGYSAGGRIALELKSRFPQNYGRVIAFSAHPGLKTDEEKRARWESDQKWIDLLKTAPFELFLEKWYDQELFNSLKKHPQFANILARRKTQNPSHLAHFLEHNSLAKKSISDIFPSTIFAYGKEDLKYAKLYRKLVTFTVENAGHAVHLENPKACAMIIKGALDEHY